jgi:uncharacterized protein YndB with AHSA1/START domain
MAERILVIKRLLPAKQQAVFAAWTDPGLMARWFFAGTDWTASVSNELRVGGSYRVDMREPGGAVYTQQGVYLEIVPHSRLSMTWSNESVRDSVIVLEFRPRGSQTELVLAHHLPDDAELYAMHQTGWLACLANLDGLFAARPEPPAG